MGLPMTWWYCRMTSSGVGPRNRYSSTTPPIALQQQHSSARHMGCGMLCCTWGVSCDVLCAVPESP
jgi:hypothetical protein